MFHWFRRSGSKTVKSHPGQYFYAVRIGYSRLQVAVWQQSPDAQAIILSQSQYASWTPGDYKHLLKQIDVLLAECMSNLPDSFMEPEVVLYALPDGWLIGNKLKPEYVAQLKHISSQLELKTLGYVPTSSALVHGMVSHGQANLSAVLLGIDNLALDVNLVIQGKIQRGVSVTRSDDFLKDFSQAIKNLNFLHLPSRIVLYDSGSDLSHYQQQLLELDWQEEKHFLHLPAIAVWDENQVMSAVVQSTTEAPSQADSDSAVESTQPAPQPQPESQTKTEPADPRSDHLTEPSPVQDRSQLSEDQAEQLTDLGFVKEQDIQEIDDQPVTISSSAVEAKSDLDQQPRSPDQAEKQSQPVQETIKIDENDNSVYVQSQAGQPAPVVVVEPPARQTKAAGGGWFRRVLFVLLLFILLLAAAGGYWYTSARAKVIIFAKLQPVSQEMEFRVIGPDSESEESTTSSQLMIQTQKQVVTTSGSVTVDTSGEDEVGEKATGKVTIYNDTDAIKRLPKGTLIKDQKTGLRFVLDEAVEVASKSVNFANDPPFRPGQATAAVVAVAIGPDYNLPANSTFSVANYSASSVLARNQSAFSGGFSREVRVVAEKDRQKAAEMLLNTLKQQAISQLTQQLSSNQQLISDTITTRWVSKKYDKSVGEEGNTLVMSGELELTAWVYDEQQVYQLAREKLLSSQPNGNLSDKLETQVELVNLEDGKYLLKVNITGYIKPEINIDNIRQKLAGQLVDKMQNGYLKSRDEIARTEIEIFPPLPIEIFPYQPDRIEIELTYEP